VSTWLAGCGLNIVFTIARQPYCVSETGVEVAAIDVGVSCIIQRTGVGASLLSL